MYDIFVAYDMFSISDIMREGDVYMEIGAHVGRFLDASKLLRNGCKYHLFEPGNWQYLKDKYSSNGYDISVYPEAVWTENRPMQYHKDSGMGQGNTLVSGVHPAVESVMAITLQQAMDKCGKAIRFLAINAEQAEYELLKLDAINNAEFITCEFHPGMSKISTVEFVNEFLPQFETLKLGRMGDPYNQWIGKRR
jgi:FkbM family methyltransferase